MADFLSEIRVRYATYKDLSPINVIEEVRRDDARIIHCESETIMNAVFLTMRIPRLDFLQMRQLQQIP